MQECFDTLMRLENVSKSFPGVLAVDDVSLGIAKGEVHIIIGENGAGKSTLVKMMAGLIRRDHGEMFFEGKSYTPLNVLDAQAQGINIIHQELSIMPNRSVAENIYVGREPVKGILGVVDVRAMNRNCKELLDNLGIEIDPQTTVKDLSIAQQQMIEVAKAVSKKNKLLIMDEPTSSLTLKEIERLFTITRRLRNNGISVIYISHRMQELMEIGDRITVMRDGRHIGTKRTDEVSMQDLITMMVGRKIETIYPKTNNVIGEEILRTDKLTGLRFRNASVAIRKGEIVGLAGLIGAGRTELAKAIYGYDPVLSGEIVYDSRKIDLKRHNSSQAVSLSLSLIPEDRRLEGLFLTMSVRENILQSSWKYLFGNGIVRNKVIRDEAKKGINQLNIHTPSAEKSVFQLSGGNQQKVVIAKWMVKKSKLLIFDEPTRGIDVGAKTEIYGLMNALAAEGAGILMISSDLPELLGLADRIYVMKDGEIAGEVVRNSAEFNQEDILQIAIGGGKCSK